MGASGSSFAPRILPRTRGSVAVHTIESGECCSPEPWAGRTFDESWEKPHFVDISPEAWASFTATTGALVRTYRPEGRFQIFLPLGFTGFILCHPTFTPLGARLSQAALLALSMTSIVVGFVAMLVGSYVLRRKNRRVDAAIEELLRRTCTDRTKFELVKVWAGDCKPNHARTYRALVITAAFAPVDAWAERRPQRVGVLLGGAPAAATGVPIARGAAVDEHGHEACDEVQIICPDGRRPGERLTVDGPDGRPHVFVVPEGVGPGQGFGVSFGGSPVRLGGPPVRGTPVAVLDAAEEEEGGPVRGVPIDEPDAGLWGLRSQRRGSPTPRVLPPARRVA